MRNSKKSSTDRQAILASLKARQKAKQRKWNVLVYGGFGLLLAAIAAAVAISVTGSIQEKNAAAEAAKRPIEGIQTYPGLAGKHVQGPVSYPHEPGAGGDHSATWSNCGVYTEPISEERAVHSLEHGAVWLTYNSSLTPAGINELTALAKDKPYVLLSPVKDQAAPVTATAWGAQLTLQNTDDSRIPAFINAYVQSPNAPEPGAPCTGGADG
ncbi:DUF3105 domain-containing protein [Arthrobacter sp. QXT-31]|uniref:DUF3105 domain-containing protein n=1 Tax=Arthrobacter sp. QXT-31 TaxID=1357915 RepID=UPI0009719C32|nr:DUF3105 domain-containing protein [Arthrobacter sp. QXT-31]APX03571.1 hypothetical protein BWQ92_19255 [Arthrobacter sp. QXT-31]